MQILTITNPFKFQRIGQTVEGFNSEHWEKVSKDIIYKACEAKFQQNPYLMSCLKDTNGSKLIFANPKDTILSCGLALGDRHLFREASWSGLNWLGEILMTIRDTSSLGYTYPVFSASYQEA